jgi:hypothetical protein
MSDQKQDLKSGLQTWAKKNELGPSELAQALGYSYQYAWRLLNGSLDVSESVLGRIVMRFGPAAVQEVAQFAEIDTE